MVLDQISKSCSEKWTTPNLSIDTLEKNLFEAIRNLDYNNCEMTSDLCSAPLHCFGDRAIVPLINLHVILGFMSDAEFTTTLDVGGTVYGEPIKFHANTLTPALRDARGESWPLVNPQYHEIRLSNVPKGAKVWAIGIRLCKDKLKCLENTVVPGLLYNENGCICSAENFENSDNYASWTPLQIA